MFEWLTGKSFDAKHRYENRVDERIETTHHLLIIPKIDQETIFIVNVKAACSEKTLIGLSIPGLIAFADPWHLNSSYEDLPDQDERRPQLTAFTVNRAQDEMHQIKVELNNTLHKESKWSIENI